MVPVITFIGSGKNEITKLVDQVIEQLQLMGYRVGRIRSVPENTKDANRPTGPLSFSATKPSIEAELSSDQLLLKTSNENIPLQTLLYRYFTDVDIVLGEGFEHARKISKITVICDKETEAQETPHGIIAVATNQKGVTGNHVFRMEEVAEIAKFLETRFLTEKNNQQNTTLLINGNKVPLKNFIKESLAGTVHGFISALKISSEIEEIELRIRVTKP